MNILAELLQVGKIGDLQATGQSPRCHAERHSEAPLESLEPLSTLLQRRGG